MIAALRGLIWRRREITPATEPANNIASRELDRGANYLVKEPKAELSLEIFASLVKGRCMECDHSEAFPCESIGCKDCTLPCTCKACKHIRAQGLCFTMRSPEDIRMRHALQTTPIFWISNHGPEGISPTSLEMMADIINRFLKKSRNPVVLLDGVEYILFANGFSHVLKFLQDIQEWVILNNAILILPINPAAVEEKELALIERNMKCIDN